MILNFPYVYNVLQCILCGRIKAKKGAIFPSVSQALLTQLKLKKYSSNWKAKHSGLYTLCQCNYSTLNSFKGSDRLPNSKHLACLPQHSLITLDTLYQYCITYVIKPYYTSHPLCCIFKHARGSALMYINTAS